jgi:hypothetical protein
MIFLILACACGCAIRSTEGKDYCQGFGCEHDAVSLLQMAHEVTSKEHSHQATAPQTSVDNGGMRDAWNTSWKLSSWLYLHVGKTGGGTVMSRARHLELDLEPCHPRPTDCSIEGRLENALISVRDPIDVFESAFNWRCTVVCAPNESDRVAAADLGFYTPQDIARNCKNNTMEGSILNVKYSRNVNALAESLCSMDEKIRQEALDDVNHILHVQDPQAKWMQIGMVKQKRRVATIVLEPGFELEPQIDASFAWALKESGVNVTSDQFPEFIEDDSYRHISATQESFPPLTEAATRCLAQHFREDYASLDWLRSNACHGIESQTCMAALESILDRRALLLQSVAS